MDTCLERERFLLVSFVMTDLCRRYTSLMERSEGRKLTELDEDM